MQSSIGILPVVFEGNVQKELDNVDEKYLSKLEGIHVIMRKAIYEGDRHRRCEGTDCNEPFKENLHSVRNKAIMCYVPKSECRLGWESNPSLYCLRYFGVAVRFRRVKSESDVIYKSTRSFLLSRLYEWKEDFVEVLMCHTHLMDKDEQSKWKLVPKSYKDSHEALKMGFVNGPVFPDYVKFVREPTWPLEYALAEEVGTNAKSKELNVSTITQSFKKFFSKKKNDGKISDVEAGGSRSSDVVAILDSESESGDSDGEEKVIRFKRQSTTRTTSLMPKKRNTIDFEEAFNFELKIDGYEEIEVSEWSLLFEKIWLDKFHLKIEEIFTEGVVTECFGMEFFFRKNCDSFANALCDFDVKCTTEKAMLCFKDCFDRKEEKDKISNDKIEMRFGSMLEIHPYVISEFHSYFDVVGANSKFDIKFELIDRKYDMWYYAGIADNINGRVRHHNHVYPNCKVVELCSQLSSCSLALYGEMALMCHLRQKGIFVENKVSGYNGNVKKTINV